jgi:hypothetical protein
MKTLESFVVILTVLFATGLPPAPSAAQTAEERAEVVFWSGIQASTNADDFAAYLDKYPNGVFAAAARRRLATLREAEAARAANTEREAARGQQEAIAARRRFMARHPHVGLQEDGYLQITPEGLTYTGTIHHVTLSKSDIEAVIIQGGAQGGWMQVRAAKKWLTPFDARDDKDAPSGGWRKAPKAWEVRNLIVETWGFVTTESRRTADGAKLSEGALVPPPPSSPW